MRKPFHLPARAALRTARENRVQLHWWFAALLVIAGILSITDTQAATGLCTSGSQCLAYSTDATAGHERQLVDFGPALQLSGNRRDSLSSQEFFSFSGVGAIVCTVNGKRRMSTAFLVGSFDLAVTVAHTFEDDGAQVAADNCIYTSTDSLGQIRERIGITRIKSQWTSETGAAGDAAKDLAVVRLSEPSHYAQRTMPLGKFSGAASPVLMIGFRDDLESDPMKSKSRGTAYERKARGVSLASLEGFTHDIDARGIAAGAPVIDERTGVIIGIHTVRAQPEPSSGRTTLRNTMITMNEWLEDTLLLEMQSGDEKGANSAL
ncbi:MAG TPA: trypsin-like peptidase domain-containing protein [Povalibacter sp.]